MRLISPVRRAEVEAQRQAVQVLDRAQREPALQALIDRAVERPAQLVEDPREPLQQHVAGQDRERRRERSAVDAQMVDRGGEQQRHQGIQQGRAGRAARW